MTEPTPRELRQFAGIWAPAALGILGLIVWSRTGGWLAPAILWGVGVLIAAVGLAAPPRIRLVYRTWMRAVHPLGWLVSHLVLAIVFYLVLTPVGLILRLVGYDPLGRRFDRAAESYWLPHRPARGVDRYFRQF